ncbi:MAG: porphobilinogen synthase, partial [Thermoleophilia bacterium]|nr:porphobilinogen synthase [Thermoleophilia bacterium]
MNAPGILGADEPRGPVVRPRRLRVSPAIRDLVRETALDVSDLIAPLFVRPGSGVSLPVPSMPGQFQWSCDTAVEAARELMGLGVRAVLLFGIPDTKDDKGTANYDPEGVVPTTIRALKRELPGLVVVSDMCFCEYTDHGHCGLVNSLGSEWYRPDLPDEYVLNDPTLRLLAKAAVVHASAGADVIAPSGMMDGMVGAIRHALDEAGFEHTSIMSYAVKYASAFYGPFRDAA